MDRPDAARTGGTPDETRREAPAAPANAAGAAPLASGADGPRFAAVAPQPRGAVPAADAILGVPIPLLDHGFVYLVDYLGGDAAIARAARVSYGPGTRSVSDDAVLLRYLLRHQHTSPFEMTSLVFHVKAPIFVARQIVRHRTACLVGATTLSFDLPDATARGRQRHHGVTIEALYRFWHEDAHDHQALERTASHDRGDALLERALRVERAAEDLQGLVAAGARAATQEGSRAPRRDRLRQLRLRMCDESTGEMLHTTVNDVQHTGIRPVFRVTLDDGKTLTMTKDHRCLTERGWLTLEQATGLVHHTSGGVTWSNDAPAFATHGVPSQQHAEWRAAPHAAGRHGVSPLAEASGVASPTLRACLRTSGLRGSRAARYRLSARSLRARYWSGGRPRHATGERLRTSAELPLPLDDVWNGRRDPLPRPGNTPLGEHLGNLREHLGDLKEHVGEHERRFRRWVKVRSIEYAGEQATYDIAVSGPYHNFVANGFIVHNSMNEVSARYSILPEEMYVPDATALGFQSTNNKQGRTADGVPAALAEETQALLAAGQRAAYADYEALLGRDVARELARLALPVSTYTEWYWKMDLHNLLRFLALRLDPHAQHEVRVYAEAMALIVQRVAPVAHQAFEDYQRQGARLSRTEREIVGRALRGEPIDARLVRALGKRERAEFAATFGIDPLVLVSPATPPAAGVGAGPGMAPEVGAAPVAESNGAVADQPDTTAPGGPTAGSPAGPRDA